MLAVMRSLSRGVTFLVLSVLVLGAGAFGLNAQNYQQMIKIGSPDYDSLDYLYLESGMVLNTAAKPFSEREFLYYLSAIPYDGLSAEGKKRYDRLKTAYEKPALVDTEGFVFDAALQVNAEFYAKTQPDKANWLWSYDDKKSILSAPLGIGLFDFAYIGFDFDLRGDPVTYSDNENGWQYSNIVTNVGYLDYQFPFRTYASIGGEHWNVELGRDQLELGPGQFSKLVISDNADFYEFLDARIYWNFFKYDFLFISMDPGLVDGETLPSNGGQEAYKSYYNHRFELSLFDKVSLTIDEGYMVGGLPPELKYFVPFMIFHSFTDWFRTSSLFSAELRVNPWKYFEFYSQLMWNQIQLAYEHETYGNDDQANAMGYMLGIKGTLPTDIGSFHAGAEWALTEPQLYVRESPLTSYHWRRQTFSNSEIAGELAYLTKPMGWEYGNDAITVNVWFGFEIDALLKAQLAYRYVAKGEQNVDSPYFTGPGAIAMKTPTGTPNFQNSLALSATVTPFPFLEIGATIAYVSEENYLHQTGNNFAEMQFSGYVGGILRP